MGAPSLHGRQPPPQRMSGCCSLAPSQHRAQRELGTLFAVFALLGLFSCLASFFIFGQRSSAPITIFSVFAHQGCLSAIRGPTKPPGPVRPQWSRGPSCPHTHSSPAFNLLLTPGALKSPAPAALQVQLHGNPTRVPKLMRALEWHREGPLPWRQPAVTQLPRRQAEPWVGRGSHLEISCLLNRLCSHRNSAVKCSASALYLHSLAQKFWTEPLARLRSQKASRAGASQLLSTPWMCPELRGTRGASGRGGLRAAWTLDGRVVSRGLGQEPAESYHPTPHPLSPTHFSSDPTTESPVATPRQLGCPPARATVPPRTAPLCPPQGPSAPYPQQRHLHTGRSGNKDAKFAAQQRELCDESPLCAHLLGSLRSPEGPSNLSKVEQP